MKSLENWLEEYGESHKNSINKVIHWICVPLIFFSLVGLLYGINLHFQLMEVPLTLAHVVLFLVIVYYLRLSTSLAIGMTVFSIICLTLCNALQIIGARLWFISLIIFIAAWIGQFVGHKIEGKKPSFLKDIQFLLIGPIWLLDDLYSKLNIDR